MSKLMKSSMIIAMIAIVVTACKNDDDDDNNNNNNNNNTPTYGVIKITTNYGDIMFWLYDQTPIHKNNFDSLTKAGFYDGLTFHRVIDGFMIQGGDPSGNGTGGPGYTLPAEFVDSLTHVQGAVAAARTNNPEKRSSGSQFYIVENASGTHFLDGDYTVFGIVFDGISTVEAIAVVPKDGNDKPLTDVVMTKVEVVQLTAAQLKNNYGFTIPGK